MCKNSVAQAYVNQKKLDMETKTLQTNATHFVKQTQSWLKLVEDFNQSLKVTVYSMPLRLNVLTIFFL